MAVSSYSVFYYLLFSVLSFLASGDKQNVTSTSPTNGMSKEEKMALR